MKYHTGLLKAYLNDLIACHPHKPHVSQDDRRYLLIAYFIHIYDNGLTDNVSLCSQNIKIARTESLARATGACCKQSPFQLAQV